MRTRCRATHERAAFGGCALLLLALLSTCRPTSSPEQDAAVLDHGRPDVQSTPSLVSVCATGCDYPEIYAAIQFVSTAANPAKQPLTIEVRDSREYSGSPRMGELRLESILSHVPVALRAATGFHPVIVGKNTSSDPTVPQGNALAIGVPDVTVSGFVFKGKSQRAVHATAPGLTLDHNAFTADYGYWTEDTYFRGNGVFLDGEGAVNASLYNNTFYDCQTALQIIPSSSLRGKIKLRNNIFVQRIEGHLTPDNQRHIEPIIWIKGDVAAYQAAAQLDFDYNLYFLADAANGAGAIAFVSPVPETATVAGGIADLPTWQSLKLDPHGISQDPLLFKPAEYDFHLQSAGGRYAPAGSGTGGEFVNDVSTSPAIDTGDPSFPVGDETPPNGSRIDMGCFGGTAEASHTKPST